MNRNDIERFVWSLVDKALTQFKSSPANRQYLYYRTSTQTEPGEVVMVPDGETPPPDFKLATPEPFHGRMPYDQVKRKLRQVLGYCPVLPLEG